MICNPHNSPFLCHMQAIYKQKLLEIYEMYYFCYLENRKMDIRSAKPYYQVPSSYITNLYVQYTFRK